MSGTTRTERELLERHVDSGFVPGMMAVLARHGQVHIEATGSLAFEGAGSRTAMAGDSRESRVSPWPPSSLPARLGW